MRGRAGLLTFLPGGEVTADCREMMEREEPPQDRRREEEEGEGGGVMCTSPSSPTTRQPRTQASASAGSCSDSLLSTSSFSISCSKDQ